MHNTMGMLEKMKWDECYFEKLSKLNSLFGDSWPLILFPSCYYNMRENTHLVSIQDS